MWVDYMPHTTVVSTAISSFYHRQIIKKDIKGGKKSIKQRAPALSDSTTFHQLWDALGSKLIESTQEHLLYTRIS